MRRRRSFRRGRRGYARRGRRRRGGRRGLRMRIGYRM